jgi:NTP pyrophosphatase (non-canonical NTP hydrolase)
MSTFDQVQKAVLEFRDERDWVQFHNPKDLAISISLEAAELLETFQWSGEDLWRSAKLDEQTEELADIVLYCILLADRLDVNLPSAMMDKIAKNDQKYPVDKALGRSDKYTEL